MLSMGIFSARAETPGFGYINRQSVKVRQGMDEKIIYSLPEGHCVYVLSVWQDKKENTWYRFVTQRQQDGVWTVRRGWVPAEYVDVNGAAFSDIVQISAGDSGFLALREDGTVTGCARVINATSAFDKKVASWENAVSVTAGLNTYACIFEDGTTEAFGLYAYGMDGETASGIRCDAIGNKRRTMVTEGGEMISNAPLRFVYPADGPTSLSGIRKIAQDEYSLFMLMEDGTVACASPEEDTGYFQIEPTDTPDFENWTDIVDIDTTLWHPDGAYFFEVFGAVKADGTVAAWPRRIELMADGWTDVVSLSLAPSYMMALRADGGVYAAGYEKKIVQEVQTWTDIVQISAAADYCVGLKKDGSLVFAGDFEYSR